MAKFAFVQNVFEDQLGVLWISAFLKSRGHESEVFIVSSPRAIPRALGSLRPDIVGFPCTTGNAPFVMDAAREVKSSSGALTVVGGPHPTHLPGIIADDPVDIVCIGEGEYAMEDLANAMDRRTDHRRIPNLWVKHEGEIFKNEIRPLVADLDDLPFPDRSYYRRYRFLRTKTTKCFICSRGCPFNCSFCSNPAFKRLYRGKGTLIRFRSPDNVVQEILRVKADSPLSYCQFMDELMISRKEWLFEFLALYRREVRLPFSCSIHAHIADDEIIRALKNSGCYYVNFGVETGNEALRNDVLKKSTTDEDIYRTASLLKKCGLRFKTFNMFGIPGETVDDSLATLRINRKIKPDYVWASVIQFFPGCDITAYALQKGAIDEHYLSRMQNLFFKASTCRIPRLKEIVRIQKLLDALVKIPLPEKAVRALIKLPLDFLYETVFLFFYGMMVWRSTKRGFFNTLVIGARSLRLFSFRSAR